MTYEWTYFIYLYGCGVTSVSAAPPKKMLDWEKLFMFADRQVAGSVIAYALKRSPDTGCPAGLQEQARRAMLGSSLQNTLRYDGIFRMLDCLEKNGIPAVVLKGFDVARFYAHPECRSAADTDILIPPSMEQKAWQLFRQNGFEVFPRGRDCHHSSCRSKESGLFEVHISLWDDAIDEGMFGGEGDGTIFLEHRRQVSFAGRKLYVPEPTEALLFMTMHLIKHFILSGAGLRMTYDMALYFARNRDQIDTARYWGTVEQLGFSRLVGALLGVMVRYAGFDAADFSGMTDPGEEACTLLGDSMEQGNIQMEINASLHNEVWNYFAGCRNARRYGKTSARARVTGRLMGERLHMLFPGALQLSRQYPYLEKRRWLYPAAWAQRAVRALRKDRRQLVAAEFRIPEVYADEHRLSDEARLRAELFQKLEML